MTTRHYEITNDALLFLELINLMKKGELDPNVPLTDTYGEWQDYARTIYDEYIACYEGDDGKYTHKKSAMAAVTRVLQALMKNDEGLFVLLSEVVPTENDGPARVEKAVKAIYRAPALPARVAFFDEQVTLRIALARVWLDAYITWSTVYSPRGPRIFHEACGLWLLSAVAMRRIVVPIGEGVYTNLYMMLCAGSSLYAKSTTIAKAKAVLRQIGLGDLLVNGRMTPEVFYRLASGRVPDDYDAMTEAQQEALKRRLAFAGKQPLEIPEFGNLLASMLSTQSPMKLWETIMLSWDDCAAVDSNTTIARGSETVTEPYLSLMTSLTPNSIQTLPKNVDPYERGFFGRFVIITPRKEDVNLKRRPSGLIQHDEAVTKPLADMHYALGIPQVGDIQEIVNKKGVRTGFHLEHEPYPENECTLADGVYDRYCDYGDALGMMVHRGQIAPQLVPTYARFQEKAMRVAALLSWIGDGGGHIEMHHWAAAQEIAEGWRDSAHEYLNQVTNSGNVAAVGVDLEDKIIKFVQIGQENGAPMKAYDISSRIRATSEAVNKSLHNMCEGGILQRWVLEHTVTKTRKVYVYTLAHAPAPEGAILEETSEQGKEN